jgi:branched-chain amino acid transport system permease protein
MIEMTYHLTLDLAMGSTVNFFGFPFDTQSPQAWVFALTLVTTSAVAFETMRRYFKDEWDRIQVEIEDWIRDNPDA